MTEDAPHVQAAFINAIAEEGTKTEAIWYLQKYWNECCALRAHIRMQDKLGKNHKERIEALEEQVAWWEGQGGQLLERIEALEAAGRFLIDRLEEFDPGDDEPEREYHGHVAPALARFRDLFLPTANDVRGILGAAR